MQYKYIVEQYRTHPERGTHARKYYAKVVDTETGRCAFLRTDTATEANYWIKRELGDGKQYSIQHAPVSVQAFDRMDRANSRSAKYFHYKDARKLVLS